ncbi:ABC transporter ATP-binding protein [Clostridium sediminicola]|uniref:ABC transporter ATP-binding protein n=1 Tax=Clostridium sediminicola TaxID=3114879 RepID=UPI0031F25D0E
MLLTIDNLIVNYGYISALRGTSMEINENEIVTLIGGNGAGKSTTLMSISGLVDKDSGVIKFNGEDISNMHPADIVSLGIAHVPEGRNIFPKLSVEENLVMGSVVCKNLSKQQLNQRLEEQYQLFPRLKERRKQAGGTLSGGEQQMLAISRGLMSDPKLLMLDEPSLGLAPIIIEEIFELLLNLKKTANKTILLIEQNAMMALSIADRGYVLQNGEIVLTGKGSELLRNNDVRKAYLGE